MAQSRLLVRYIGCIGHFVNLESASIKLALQYLPYPRLKNLLLQYLRCLTRLVFFVSRRLYPVICSTSRRQSCQPLSTIKNAGQKIHSAAENYFKSSPSFSHRFLLAFRIQFPLPWLWALHKGTVLGMELAQYTASLPLIYHASAFPPSARITRPILSTSNVQSRVSRGRTAHACRKLCSAVEIATRVLD